LKPEQSWGEIPEVQGFEGSLDFWFYPDFSEVCSKEKGAIFRRPLSLPLSCARMSLAVGRVQPQ
jgi:hypothetical protein